MVYEAPSLGQGTRPCQTCPRWGAGRGGRKMRPAPWRVQIRGPQAMRTLPRGPGHLTPCGGVCRGCLSHADTPHTSSPRPSHLEQAYPAGPRRASLQVQVKKKRERERTIPAGVLQGAVKPPHPHPPHSLTLPHTQRLTQKYQPLPHPLLSATLSPGPPSSPSRGPHSLPAPPFPDFPGKRLWAKAGPGPLDSQPRGPTLPVLNGSWKHDCGPGVTGARHLTQG